MLEVAYILVALALIVVFGLSDHYCTKAWSCHR